LGAKFKNERPGTNGAESDLQTSNSSYVFYVDECRRRASEAMRRVEIGLSYVVYFVVNASVAVLVENVFVKAAALALLALGVAALLRRGSAFAEAVSALAFIFTFLVVGPILYSVVLLYATQPDAYRLFTLSVIFAYGFLVFGLIYGLPLAEANALYECEQQKQ